MLFIPLATVAMGTLEQKEIGNASGIFNLMRNVGGSAGISLLITYLARHAQKNQTVLVSRLTPLDLPYQLKFPGIQNYFAFGPFPAGSAGKAEFFIYRSLLRQSQLLAYVQGFRFLALVCLFCIAAALLFKRVKRRRMPA
ncbi:MAG: hypothetical protein M0033_11820 [Nitrospiraceae bacterium]|nr:hypothetical protein [Nitrospiraceae bacterium]